jgi:hypothetical protein
MQYFIDEMYVHSPREKNSQNLRLHLKYEMRNGISLPLYNIYILAASAASGGCLQNHNVYIYMFMLSYYLL